LVKLQEAIALDPRLFDAYHLLGYLNLQQQRYAEAIAALQRATELQPSRTSVWEYLAVAYHNAGRRDSALEAARTAKRFSENAQEAARIESTIKLIESSSGPIV
jgi:Flp pilus assembly protein TadD